MLLTLIRISCCHYIFKRITGCFLWCPNQERMIDIQNVLFGILADLFSVAVSLIIYTKVILSWWKQKPDISYFELRKSVEPVLPLTFGLCVRRGISIRPARYKCQLKILNTIYNKMMINERPAPTEFEQRYIAEFFPVAPIAQRPLLYAVITRP